MWIDMHTYGQKPKTANAFSQDYAMFSLLWSFRPAQSREEILMQDLVGAPAHGRQFHLLHASSRSMLVDLNNFSQSTNPRTTALEPVPAEPDSLLDEPEIAESQFTPLFTGLVLNVCTTRSSKNPRPSALWTCLSVSRYSSPHASSSSSPSFSTTRTASHRTGSRTRYGKKPRLL